jgi:CHAT domain-containing protein
MPGVLDKLGFAVADARSGISRDPESGDVSIEGRAALQACAEYLLGPLSTKLNSFRRAGKWHLCVQPHGALHFFPFHLLPSRSGTLAEQWAVTYLPNLSLLIRDCSKETKRPNRIASFGIDFKHRQPHGLPELYGAEDEAQLVASAYGMPAVTGSSATETAVIQAFRNAERVHIATHGNQRVSAPLFQSIYLAPEPDNEGILYAHKLLHYDLHGLDLLSLSACETSLGRVDIGDNVWGFATDALIAGVDTVIGTLWPVEDSAAQTFFNTLHSSIACGTNKLRAFKNAQEITRALHPQFRDWGAFCYSGLW